MLSFCQVRNQDQDDYYQQLRKCNKISSAYLLSFFSDLITTCCSKNFYKTHLIHFKQHLIAQQQVYSTPKLQTNYCSKLKIILIYRFVFSLPLCLVQTPTGLFVVLSFRLHLSHFQFIHSYVLTLFLLLKSYSHAKPFFRFVN